MSRADVPALAALARMFGSDLLMVHVTPEVDAPFWLKRRTSPDSTTLDRARAKSARLSAQPASTSVSVSFQVVRGDPQRRWVASQCERRAATLVLVLRRGKGMFGMARGTVTYRVLTTAATPVIVLPAGVAAARLVRAWG